MLAVLAVGEPESDAVAQQIFAHASAAGDGEDLFFLQFVHDLQDDLGFLRAFGNAGTLARPHRAFQLDRELRGRCRLHVHRVERQRRDAAELEATGGDEQCRRQRDEG
ncbi:hypothetical protein D3C83_16030 [compost metagenome]